MAQEAYRVYTFDLSLPADQAKFTGLAFLPNMGFGTEISGIVYAIDAGITLQCKHGITGDLYPVFDGEAWNHSTVDPVTGCAAGETTGFAYVSNAVAGKIVLRVTYGKTFAGPMAA